MKYRSHSGPELVFETLLDVTDMYEIEENSFINLCSVLFVVRIIIIMGLYLQ